MSEINHLTSLVKNLQKRHETIEKIRETVAHQENMKVPRFHTLLPELHSIIAGIERTETEIKILEDYSSSVIGKLLSKESGLSLHEKEIRANEKSEPVYVPTEEDREYHRDLLGCYLPGKRTILLWVDKISRYGNLRELVFQKVLLHECIHALLDVKRKPSKDYQEEETVDNAWVLQAYSDCGQPAVVNEVIDFIARQPQEYREALSLYPWMQAEKLRLNIIKDTTRNLLNHK